MSEIRNVELGTFVSSADAAARVRQAADRAQRRVQERGEQPRDQQHGDQRSEDEDAVPAEDGPIGAYDERGRRDDGRPPQQQGGAGSGRLDIAV